MRWSKRRGRSSTAREKGNFARRGDSRDEARNVERESEVPSLLEEETKEMRSQGGIYCRVFGGWEGESVRERWVEG